jgi:hypothetical protein
MIIERQVPIDNRVIHIQGAACREMGNRGIRLKRKYIIFGELKPGCACPLSGSCKDEADVVKAFPAPSVAGN